MIVLGVDPGLSGAMALVSMRDNVVWTFPLADATVESSGRGREIVWSRLWNELNCAALVFGGIDHAFVERVGAMPRQGVSSMFKFGMVVGGVHALLAAAKIPMTLVSPTKWKLDMGLSASKDVARLRASQLFPESSSLFARKKDDGAAEACLIARYGWLQLTSQKEKP